MTSLMQYLKSGPPQLHDMSSRLKDWLERSMMISMALDLSRAIWSSAVRSLWVVEEREQGGEGQAKSSGKTLQWDPVHDYNDFPHFSHH